jgi:adenylate cyclase
VRQGIIEVMGMAAAVGTRLRRAPERDARAVAAHVERRVSRSMLIAHVVGAFDMFALLFFVLPMPAGVEPRDNLAANLIGFAIYLPVALLVGHHFGVRQSAARSAWMREGREPNDEERARVLATPLHCARQSAALWVGAALLFGAINLVNGPTDALHVACTVLMGGVTTCAIAYLLVERIARPVTALALAHSGPPAAPQWPGVEGRLVLAWVSATGVPLLGTLMVAVDGLTGQSPPHEVMRAVLVLGIAALTIGAGVTVVAARTVAQPLTAVRHALARVQAGDLGSEVAVDDASEVGLLQSGFNRMVGGLRERDRVQDLYSRQVGADVARAAIHDDPSLGGQVADVAVLFVDIIGSTALAHHAPPERVVARLNRFFAVVVEVVSRHGGWVNKFEGDAALCVFGAPAALDDPAGRALAAGRELAARLRADLPGVEAGIGISAGPAVAGWVGAEQRFEYTVIGDPVNEAARLCDLAKRGPSRLLACAAVLGRADRDEAGRWRVGEAVVLRGRSAATRLALPA